LASNKGKVQIACTKANKDQFGFLLNILLLTFNSKASINLDDSRHLQITSSFFKLEYHNLKTQVYL